MLNISGMNILFESSQNLIHNVFNGLIVKLLSPEQLVQVGVHQRLHYIDVFHVIIGRRKQYVADINDLCIAFKLQRP